MHSVILIKSKKTFDKRFNGIQKPIEQSRKLLTFKFKNMKQNQNLRKAKLTLIKEKISNLSGNQMQNIVGGAGDEAAKTTKSSVVNFTCTWCTNTTTLI